MADAGHAGLDAGLDAGLAREVLKRAQFCIFAKEAPTTLPAYSTDTDFAYFFFNDAMGQRSGLDPHGLTTAGRNAKTDFPEDHGSYFEDDAAVVKRYQAPAVLDVVEPWRTPLTVTLNHTRKTAITAPLPSQGAPEPELDVHTPTARCGGVGVARDQGGCRADEHEHAVQQQPYMLGVFTPYDDVSLGITTFRASELPPALPTLPSVTDAWYDAAFEHLPVATAVFPNTTPVIAHASGDGHCIPLLLENALGRAAGEQFRTRAAEMLRDVQCAVAAAEPGALVRPLESWESFTTTATSGTAEEDSASSTPTSAPVNCNLFLVLVPSTKHPTGVHPT